MRGIPSPWLSKMMAPDIGLGELLLDSIVIDSQVPPQAHINGCRYVTTRPSSYASDRGSYGIVQVLKVRAVDIVGSNKEAQQSSVFQFQPKVFFHWRVERRRVGIRGADIQVADFYTMGQLV